MKYVIRYRAQAGRMVDDAWLNMGYGFSEPDADADVKRASKFDSEGHAEAILKRYPRLGGDGREPGVIEECP